MKKTNALAVAVMAWMSRASLRVSRRMRAERAPRPAVSVVSDYGVAPTFPGIR